MFACFLQRGLFLAERLAFASIWQITGWWIPEPRRKVAHGRGNLICDSCAWRYRIADKSFPNMVQLARGTRIRWTGRPGQRSTDQSVKFQHEM